MICCTILELLIVNKIDMAVERKPIAIPLSVVTADSISFQDSGKGFLLKYEQHKIVIITPNVRGYHFSTLLFM